ncbi:MAG TPA: vWA domain-containing protein, partial [Gammaproteobacteria bacterium]|nr:vWA domain-containing protein [Gammaproteobacteria bacterium]
MGLDATQHHGLLDERDLIGVVAFNSTARSVVDIGTNDRPEDTRARIESIGSGGGTNIGAGLRVARTMLDSVEANTKHVVLLSDGESMNPEELPSLADELGQRGIKVSTIAVGDEADEQGMRDIAQRSGGVYYRVLNPSVLPTIFLKAIRVVRTPMVREGDFTPIVLDSQSAATGALGVLPTLGGLVMTERMDDDPRVSTPIVSNKGEPVLAYHQAGLGRVSVFTSDVGAWARDWIGEPIFAQLWGTLSAWTMRSGDDS